MNKEDKKVLEDSIEEISKNLKVIEAWLHGLVEGNKYVKIGYVLEKIQKIREIRDTLGLLIEKEESLR